MNGSEGVNRSDAQIAAYRQESGVPPRSYIDGIVETARELVTAADSMLGASFWKAYAELREEIAAYEQDA